MTKEEIKDDISIKASKTSNFIEMINKGVRYYSDGKFEESLTFFDQAVEDASRAVKSALTNKAVSLTKLNRFDDAWNCCNEALEIDHTDCRAWNQMGLVYEKLGKFDDAIHCFDKVIEITSLEPDLVTFPASYEVEICAMAWYNKYRIFEEMGKVEESEKCYVMAEKLGHFLK